MHGRAPARRALPSRCNVISMARLYYVARGAARFLLRHICSIYSPFLHFPRPSASLGSLHALEMPPTLQVSNFFEQFFAVREVLSSCVWTRMEKEKLLLRSLLAVRRGASFSASCRALYIHQYLIYRVATRTRLDKFEYIALKRGRPTAAGIRDRRAMLYVWRAML